MLHPYPPADSEEHKGGISKSLLIDFDLSGRPGEDLYPPGYSENVKDNAFDSEVELLVKQCKKLTTGRIWGQ